MHELALAQEICRTVRAHLPEGKRLVKVVVEYGPFCGVVPQALDFSFLAAARHFGLEGARLELLLIPGNGRCPGCQVRFLVQSMWQFCPECGFAPVTVAGGGDLRVSEIEVDELPGAVVGNGGVKHV